MNKKQQNWKDEARQKVFQEIEVEARLDLANAEWVMRHEARSWYHLSENAKILESAQDGV